MKGNKTSKIILFGSLLASLFAIAIAAVSTAAWFQIEKQTETITSNNGNEAGDNDLINITNVSGYKYHYDQTDNATTSTTNGTVIGLGKENIDEDEIVEIDNAPSGVGYYLVFENNEGAYRYDNNTIKMTDQYDSNYAFLETSLTAGTKFMVKEHTYGSVNGNTQTIDTAITSFATNSETTTNLSTNSSGVIEVTNSGTYHLYLNGNKQFAVGSFSAPANLAFAGGPAIKKGVSTNFRVYLRTERDGRTEWEGDNTRYAICLQKNGSDTWASMIDIGDHMHTCWVPSGDFDKFFFVRMYGDNPTNVWSSKYTYQQEYNSLSDSSNCIAVNSSGCGDKYKYHPTIEIGYGPSGQSWSYTSFSNYSVTKTLTKGTAFKVIINSSKYYGFNKFANAGSFSTYFSGSNDSDITVVKSCTFTLSFDGGSGWNFSASSVSTLERTITLKYRRFNSNGSAADGGTAAAYNYYENGTTNTTTTTDSETFSNYPSTPICEGYEFEGWYTNEACTSSFNSSNPITADTTLVAKFQIANYSLVIEAWCVSENSLTKTGNRIDVTDSATVGSDAELYKSGSLDTWTSGLSNPGTNYEFKGYYTTLTGSTFSGLISDDFYLTGNTTLYKVYEPKYAITITTVKTTINSDAVDGSAIGSVTVRLGRDSRTKTLAWLSEEATSFSDSDYYEFGYYTSCTDGTLGGTLYQSGSITFDRSTTIYRVFKPFLTVTVNLVYLINNTYQIYGDIAETGTNSSIRQETNNVTQTILNGIASSFSPDTTNYSVKGFFKTLSDGELSNQISGSESIMTDATYYLAYTPKTTSVDLTFEYSLFTRNVEGGNDTPFLDSNRDAISISSTCFDVYYGETLGDITRAPGTETYRYYGDSTSSGQGAYKFEWDGRYYTSAACTTEYTPTRMTSDTTVYLKLVAKYRKLHVSIRNTTGGWAANGHNGNIKLHYADASSPNTGDANTDLILDYDTTTGIRWFNLSNSVSVMIYDSSSTLNNDRYTPEIRLDDAGLTTNDCDGRARGSSDMIEIVNGISSNWHVKWLWSIYFSGRSANIYFANGDSEPMYRGDGAYNMFVYDKGYQITSGSVFGICDNNGHWYGYNELDERSKTYVANNGGTANLGVAPNKSTSAFEAIRCTITGYYSFYLTARGELSLASVPNEKGSGFYIMQYDSSGITGNNNTFSYEGGVKMRATGISGNGNVAYYKYFYVSDDDNQYYISSYLSGVAKGLVTKYDTKSENSSLASISDGILTVASKGFYDIYVNYVDGEYTIYLRKYDDSDNHYLLNNLSGSSSQSNNTSLVIEVEFSSKSSKDITIGADFVRTTIGGGISRYLKFAVVCYEEKQAPREIYETMNGLFSTATAFATNNTKAFTLFDNTNTISGGDIDPHYLYILVDYSAAPSGTYTNDMYINIHAKN